MIVKFNGEDMPAFDCMHWALSTEHVNDIAGLIQDIATWASCRDIGGRTPSSIVATARYGYATTIARELQPNDIVEKVIRYSELPLPRQL